MQETVGLSRERPFSHIESYAPLKGKSTEKLLAPMDA